MTLEICPRFLVPDTNCFVDHLPSLRQLSSSGLYQIRVPLVVLHELDGLAKGGIHGKYTSREHAKMVQENAKRGVAFLKERGSNTKCITSKGTILTSLAVTTEQDGEGGKNNDDLILEACCNLHRSSRNEEEEEQEAEEKNVVAASGGCSKNKLLLLQRDVVLLTEDRNLKLKAHVNDVIVDKIDNFMNWAFSDITLMKKKPHRTD